jgi:hypothetical protein
LLYKIAKGGVCDVYDFTTKEEAKKKGTWLQKKNEE